MIHRFMRSLRRRFGIHGLSPFARSGRLRTRSTSHSVAAERGCTKIPLAAGRAQEDETILEIGYWRHANARFVHLDPPRLIGSR